MRKILFILFALISFKTFAQIPTMPMGAKVADSSLWKINGVNIYNKNTGNVGIGTTTPRSKLDLIGEIGIDAVGGYSRTWNYLNGALKWTVGLRNSNDYYIYREGVAGNVLVPIGNVGIGTTTPNAQLQLGNTVVNRKIVLYENANNNNQFYGFGVNASTLRYQIPTTIDKHSFFVGTSATTSIELMTIRGNGNVGIGTTTPTQKLHVIGNILASGTITPSDKRLKSNIKEVTYGVSDLLKLKAVSYTKKFSLDKAEKGEVKEFGFIAQDLQKVFPELVTENGADKLLAVNYTSLIPLLVKSIQELKAEIEVLKLKIK